VKHDTCHEPLLVTIPERSEMTRTSRSWRGVSLDFDGDKPTPGQLSKEIDLEPSLSLAYVMQARPSVRDGELSSQLGEDERIEQATEQVATPHHQVDIEAEHGGRDRWIDDVALR
jgi:hypothetical protein